MCSYHTWYDDFLNCLPIRAYICWHNTTRTCQAIPLWERRDPAPLMLYWGRRKLCIPRWCLWLCRRRRREPGRLCLKRDYNCKLVNRFWKKSKTIVFWIDSSRWRATLLYGGGRTIIIELLTATQMPFNAGKCKTKDN